jgi:hypothetical protein
MDAAMATAKERLEWEGCGEVCTIAVIYHDVASRDCVAEVLAPLLWGFKGELTFEISWWGFKYLCHEEISQQAAKAASKADVILVSVQSRQDIPSDVKAWFERWLLRRTPAEAALGLLELPTGSGDSSSPEAVYFQGLAQRAGLDYLTFGRAEPAVQSSPRLAEGASGPRPAPWAQPLDDGYHSSGWGINE